MSTRYDILAAKREHEQHIAEHGCVTSDSARRAGQIPCAKRVETLQAWFGTAGMWGREPDDDRRQREQFNAQLRPAAA